MCVSVRVCACLPVFLEIRTQDRLPYSLEFMNPLNIKKSLKYERRINTDKLQYYKTWVFINNVFYSCLESNLFKDSAFSCSLYNAVYELKTYLLKRCIYSGNRISQFLEVLKTFHFVILSFLKTNMLKGYITNCFLKTSSSEMRNQIISVGS